MTCPDPIALARANPPNSDPEVVEHLGNCPSCWLDWQIQQGTRYALQPDTQVSPGLNERAIARIEREARRKEEIKRWWDLPILGALVATATFACFVAGGGVAATAIPPVPTAIWAVLMGTVAALYTKYRELREYGDAGLAD